MTSPRSALWLVGFRPFFLLAMAAGVFFPLWWAAAYRGLPLTPIARLNPVQWHAHEMLFGFGWAVLAGFLLTATKNWVKVRGHHGGTLMLLVALWVLERVVISLADRLSAAAFLVGANAFLLTATGLILWTLLRHRRTDTYGDNFIFLGALPLFIVGKNLLLSPVWYGHGWALSIGLFRLAMVVMLERTMVQFMKAHFQVEVRRRPLLDGAIKALAALSVGSVFLPAMPAAALLMTLALLLLLRLLSWRPLVALRRLDVAVMNVGLIGLIAHLILSALRLAELWEGVGNVAVHAFTMGSMGLVIPALMTRISLGHTGRPVLFTWAHKAALWALVAGALVRLVLTQLAPSRYPLWIDLASMAWALAFGLLAVTLAPLLLRPRVDGRDH